MHIVDKRLLLCIHPLQCESTLSQNFTIYTRMWSVKYIYLRPWTQGDIYSINFVLYRSFVSFASIYVIFNCVVFCSSLWFINCKNVSNSSTCICIPNNKSILTKFEKKALTHYKCELEEYLYCCVRKQLAPWK